MSWYTTGTVNLTNSSKTVTGVGTKWTNPLIGVCAGQMLILKTANTIEIYEIASVQSDTQLTLANQYSGASKTDVSYEIPTAPNVSIEALALRISEMLNYYQQQMVGWQSILTGIGDIALTAPDGRVVTVKSQKALTEAINNTIKKTGEENQSIDGSLDVKKLTEKGQRVFSPNNKPTADIVGALPSVKTGENNAPIYKVGNQVNFDVKPKINGIEPIYIIESYQKVDSWYRVYSDGFIEQSGTIKINTSALNSVCGTLVNLLKPMETQNYSVGLYKVNSGPWAQTEFAQAELGITEFWLASYTSIVGECWVRWEVRGY